VDRHRGVEVAAMHTTRYGLVWLCLLLDHVLPFMSWTRCVLATWLCHLEAASFLWVCPWGAGRGRLAVVG
jgi:hypothetical protein